MIRLGISEILASVSDIDGFDNKVLFLRKNDSPVLRHLLRLAFTPGVEWLLPPGKPPIKKNDMPGQQGNLFASWRLMYLFLPGGNPNLSRNKREFLFVQMLESLDPRDADLLCSVKDGIMPYDSVDIKLVNAAFGLNIPLPEPAVSLEPATSSNVETPVSDENDGKLVLSEPPLANPKKPRPSRAKPKVTAA